MLTLWQFPEFHRVFVGGGQMELQLTASGTATGFVFLAGRVLTNPLPFAPFGEIEIDPALLVLPNALPVAMPLGHGVLNFAVPDVPALRGFPLSFQAMIAPGAGSPYLSQSASVLLF